LPLVCSAPLAAARELTLTSGGVTPKGGAGVSLDRHVTQIGSYPAEPLAVCVTSAMCSSSNRAVASGTVAYPKYKVVPS